MGYTTYSHVGNSVLSVLQLVIQSIIVTIQLPFRRTITSPHKPRISVTKTNRNWMSSLPSTRRNIFLKLPFKSLRYVVPDIAMRGMEPICVFSDTSRHENSVKILQALGPSLARPYLLFGITSLLHCPSIKLGLVGSVKYP